MLGRTVQVGIGDGIDLDLDPVDPAEECRQIADGREQTVSIDIGGPQPVDHCPKLCHRLLGKASDLLELFGGEGRLGVDVAQRRPGGQ